MKNTLRRLTSMFTALIMCTVVTSTVYAAETVECNDIYCQSTDNSRESSVSEVTEFPNGVTVEIFEPGVVIIVTELTEDTPAPQLNSVNTYFDYKGGMDGKSRYYSGNHFSVDMVTSSESGKGNFTLRLCRHELLGTKTVGSVNLPQNGSFHVEFLNVYKPDTYWFNFNQSFFDKSRQTGTMTIYDWE